MRLPVALFAFACLLYIMVSITLSLSIPEGGRPLSKLIRRNERLDLSRQIIVSKPEQLDDFMQQAVADGCEGL